MLKSYTKFLNKENFSINSNLLINLTLGFFPISFVLGNFIINLNITLFCILGIFHLKSEVLTIKFSFPIKIIFLFFLAILFSTCLSSIMQFGQTEKLPTYSTVRIFFGGSEYINLERIIKSIFFLRYFLMLIIIYFLSKKNILNFKYFFIVSAFLPLAVSLDLIFQYNFGFNILGLKSFGHHNTSFFGDEMIAGGFIQRFSFFSILFAASIFNNKKSIRSILIIILICVLGVGILVSGNRMPLISFLTGLIFLFLYSSNLRKIIPISLICFVICFQLLISGSQSLNGAYNSLYSNIKDILISSNQVLENDSIRNSTKIEENNKKDKKTYFNDYMYQNRLILTALDIWKKNKIFGNGIKSFRIDCNKLRTHAIEPLDEYNLGEEFEKSKKNRLCSNHPHNYYLEILVETGIVGFFILLLMAALFINFVFKNFNLLNENNLKSLLVLAALVSLFLEAFPFKTTGSIFTTSNTTYIILISSILINYKLKIISRND